MSDATRDPAYEVVAAFAARLEALGVSDVVISPGSRSTPLALCFDARPRMRTWIQIDERCAGFFALGLARASGRPAVLVCTSGTAAANYLPAVVEACHAGVPMIVCTADRPAELRGWGDIPGSRASTFVDRPAELRGWGSPQTIDQVGLYGSAVRWSIDLPSPEDTTPTQGVLWADKAFETAMAADLGPVHLNWPLREPLAPVGKVPVTPIDTLTPIPDTDPDPAVRKHGDSGLAARHGHGDSGLAARHGHGDSGLAALAELVAQHERGVVVVGPWPAGGLPRERRWAASAKRFAGWAGWPLMAEPISQARAGITADTADANIAGPALEAAMRLEPTNTADNADANTVASDDQPLHNAQVITTAVHLLEDQQLAHAMSPEVAVLFGRPVTTKPLRLWLEATRPRHVILIDPERRWQRAAFRLTGHAACDAEAVEAITQDLAPNDRGAAGGWLDTWSTLDRAARHAIDEAVASGPLLSALTAQTLIEALPEDAALIAANSMPVRDLDAFVFDSRSVACTANRGASGIDGTVSTALGIAAADPARTVALYSGDLALLHDLGGLIAAERLGLNLIAVCADNDGGEIFSLLPIADRVPQADFERLFRTPHGLDLRELDGFGGIRVERVTDAAALKKAIQAASSRRAPGVDLLVVEVSADDDVAQRRHLTQAALTAARAASASVKLPQRPL